MAVLDGRAVVPTPGTAVPLSATSVAVRGVLVTPLSPNAGVVVIGGSTVVAAAIGRRGINLAATSLPVKLEVDDGFTDLRDIFIDAVTAGDGVSFTYTAL